MMKSRIGLLILFTFLIGCHAEITNRHSSGTTIVCFGDSITEGVGAARDESYPALLAKKVDLEVINAGVSGNTTADALKRLEEDVLAHDPKLVVVALGANDFLKRIPRKETLKNLDRIVATIQQHGAMVLVAGVRIGLFRNQYADVYKTTARKHKTLLLMDMMDGILDNPEYKFDQIHPNAAGYRIIADRIYKVIEPVTR